MKAIPHIMFNGLLWVVQTQSGRRYDQEHIDKAMDFAVRRNVREGRFRRL